MVADELEYSTINFLLNNKYNIMNRYDMTNDQDAQIDCRNKDCRFYKADGKCSNISPAITLNPDNTFVCWSKEKHTKSSKKVIDFINSLSDLGFEVMVFAISEPPRLNDSFAMLHVEFGSLHFGKIHYHVELLDESKELFNILRKKQVNSYL